MLPDPMDLLAHARTLHADAARLEDLANEVDVDASLLHAEGPHVALSVAHEAALHLALGGRSTRPTEPAPTAVPLAVVRP